MRRSPEETSAITVSDRHRRLPACPSPPYRRDTCRTLPLETRIPGLAAATTTEPGMPVEVGQPSAQGRITDAPHP